MLKSKNYEDRRAIAITVMAVFCHPACLDLQMRLFLYVMENVRTRVQYSGYWI